MGKKKKKQLRNINKWTNSFMGVHELMYPSNLSLKYDKTLNPERVSGDLSVSERVRDMRRAAECHRQARRHIQPLIKPGIKLIDLCEGIENKIVELFGENNLRSGIGFPVGVSLNNIAAHDSANPMDKRILLYDDVCKIDYGTHVGGNIIDCAFTAAFNPKYDKLLEATKEGTWTGIKMAGPDALISDITKEIQEVIESYEVEIDGKVHKVTAVTNLGGHNIEPYTIHAGKLVLGSMNNNFSKTDKTRMQAGECFAIETFASTGKGTMMVDHNIPVNHYMINKNAPRVNLRLGISKQLYGWIKKERSTLPFCTRWLYKQFGNKYKMGLNELVKNNIVTAYPALLDTPGTYTSQLEHTIYLHDYGKEVISVGDDY